MNILYLGPRRESIWSALTATGDKIVQTEDNLNRRPELLESVDWIISYGYRHIITPDLVAQCDQRIVNLHISLLPWNRGADPNVWSFLEDTPKGVTIHLIDAGIDTGAILAQREVVMSDTDTLRSSYDKLSVTIESLFAEQWPLMRAGKLQSQPQSGGGNYHRIKDLDQYRHLLVDGWDTPVARLIGQATKVARRGAYAS